MGVACLAELVLSLAHRHRLPAAFIVIINFQSEAYPLTDCWPRTETFLLRSRPMYGENSLMCCRWIGFFSFFSTTVACEG